MVTTVDGSIALGGASGAIGDHAPGDHALFHALRGRVDAVLAGTGTLAAERYGRLIATGSAVRSAPAAGSRQTPSPSCSRARAGSRAACRCSTTRSPVRTFTGEDADPRHALGVLREEGIEVLLCEGGPRLLGDLVRHDSSTSCSSPSRRSWPAERRRPRCWRATPTIPAPWICGGCWKRVAAYTRAMRSRGRRARPGRTDAGALPDR